MKKHVPLRIGLLSYRINPNSDGQGKVCSQYTFTFIYLHYVIIGRYESCNNENEMRP
jgi:hypothetical protein